MYNEFFTTTQIIDMKVDKVRSNIRRTGIQQESSFSIKTSAEAFEILSSGLYSDSVRAIVRELASNAYDAHVDAGTASIPFDITIPSTLDPYFRIRDYGTGLSPDDIVGVYAVYFNSTKSNSNDFIGAKGLGSKTPLSYTREFTVTSYYNGIAHHYTIFVNEDGAPAVAHMGDVETSEPNGIEISIASTENRRFSRAVSWYLAHFKVHPNLIGISDEEREVLMHEHLNSIEHSELNEEGKWFLSSASDGYDTTLGAVYGQIPFPVNAYDVEAGITSKVSTAALNFYKAYSGKLVFVFNIGELDVTASREELKYSEKTNEAFAKKITEMQEKFQSRIKNLIEGYEYNDSLYKTLRYLMADVFQNDDSFFRCINFDDIDCDEFKRLPDFRSGWNPNVYKQTVSSALGGDNKSIIASRLVSAWDSVNDVNRTINKTRLDNANIIGSGPDVTYYVIDETRNGLSKAKEDFRLRLNETALHYVIRPHNLKDPNSTQVKEALAELKISLGNPDFIYTSTLTNLPERVKRLSSESMQLRGTAFKQVHGCWDVTNTLNFADGGVYFYLAAGRSAHRGHSTNSDAICNGHITSSVLSAMVQMYNAEKSTELTTNDVYGVSAADIKAFEKSPLWTNLFDVIETHIRANKDSYIAKIALSMGASVSLQNIRDGLSDEGSVVADFFREFARESGPSKILIEKLRDDSVAKNLLVNIQELINTKDTLHGDADTLCMLLRNFMDDFDVGAVKYSIVNFDAYCEAAATAYSMLVDIPRWDRNFHSKDWLQRLTDYIIMCDTYEKPTTTTKEEQA